MHDPEAWLADIRIYAVRALSYIDQVTHDEFMSSLAVQDQTMRCLTVIGEAARRTPEEIRACFPDVPWAQMVDMRNRLMHEYDGIDMQTVWLTVTQDLPVILALLNEGPAPGLASPRAGPASPPSER